VNDARLSQACGTPGPDLPTPVPRQSILAALMAVWRRHQDLLGGASSLVATTGVTSAMGFAYWALAARLFSQRAVGYGSAAVSAMALLGTIGMFGLGTVLIGELPRRRPRVGLVAAALLACGLGSLLLGLGFAVVAPLVSGSFGEVGGAPGRAMLFAAGVALTGVGLVFDQATIGLLRGGLQLSRNLIFTAVKLLVLPATAFILHDELGVGITLAWVTGIAVSLVAVAVRLWFTGSAVLARPDWRVLRGLGRTAVTHNWLNLAMAVPWSLTPVLVTVVVSPSANAAFYAAWTLSSFLYVVPAHLSTVLFAVASADRQIIARKLRFTLLLSALIGLPGMTILGLGAHLALSMFGPSYARVATLPLWLLVIGYVPSVPRVHYIAVCRAVGKISRAAIVLTTFAVMEVAAAVAGGASAGLNGLSFALLAVFMAEGAVTAPAVFRAAAGHGRHRLEDSLSASADNLAGDARSRARIPGGAESYLSKRDRQEAGIAALRSLAKSALPVPAAPARLSPIAPLRLRESAPSVAARPTRSDHSSRAKSTVQESTHSDWLEALARRAADNWSKAVGISAVGLAVEVGDTMHGPCVHLSWNVGCYSFRGRYERRDFDSAGSLRIEIRGYGHWFPANTKDQIAYVLSGKSRRNSPLSRERESHLPARFV
jgi:O-antigen/teichoic acid export membrane protein